MKKIAGAWETPDRPLKKCTTSPKLCGAWANSGSKQLHREKTK